MRQSRAMSLVEALTNIAVGIAWSWALTYWLFPLLYNFTPSPRDTTEITAIFTVASLVRSYGLRRLFNWITR